MGILEACLVSGLIVGTLSAIVAGLVWVSDYAPEWVLVVLFLIFLAALLAFGLWASTNNFLGLNP